MSTQISDLVLSLVAANPAWTNDQVADEVQRRIPGATTSAGSVSSIKSKAKKLGGTASPLAIDTSGDNSEFDLPAETYEERSERIRTRYETLYRMALRISKGGMQGLIVSGPPGLGKSYTVEKVLSETENMVDATTIDPEIVSEYAEESQPMYDIISGTITAPGLYTSLWNMRNGGVLVLDDCDDAFRDETSLNLLKAVLDSSEVRRVSYRKKASWLEEANIPTSFVFKGVVVFCTNVDFEAAIRKGSTMAPHFQAFLDRCAYLSLTMRTRTDFLCRIRQVALEDGLLASQGLTVEEAEEIMDFIEENADRFYGLSLRLVLQVANCYTSDPINWKNDVTAIKMRTL